MGDSFRRWISVVVKAAAWGWVVVAGGGGLGLLLQHGPWPPTNGWFAMFSGISACPLWPTLLRRRANVRLPSWVQASIVVLFVVAGRVALRVERYLGVQLPPPL